MICGTTEKEVSQTSSCRKQGFEDWNTLSLPGEFEVLSLLGRGGMGIVLRAFQESLSREVAIKILPSALSEEPEYCDSLLREAQLCAQLRHPNVVQIYQIGGLPDGGLFVVMELVEGKTLRPVASGRKGRKAEAEKMLEAFFPIIFQLCDALQAAHEKGIIHRDIKPSNILVETDGRVRLMDFGIALLSSAHESERKIAGTPAYMAPEQYLSPRQTDHRCDLYALGGIMYYLLAGRPPREKNTVEEAVKEIKFEKEYADRRARIPADIPEPIIAVIEKAMSYDPEKRFQSAGQLREALEIVYLRWVKGVRPRGSLLNGSSRHVRFAAAMILLALAGAGTYVYLGATEGIQARGTTPSEIVMLRQGIERQLNRADLAPEELGLLRTWHQQMLMHEETGDYEAAYETGVFASQFTEREHLKKLSESLAQLAQTARDPSELKMRSVRYLAQVDDSLTGGADFQQLAELRAEGMALFLDLQASLQTSPVGQNNAHPSD